MRYDESTTTTASRDRAWAAVAGVTTWPQWTVSMTSVEPLDGTALAVGRRYRVRQPGLPPIVWKVTELADQESFVWVADSPGVHTVAYHRLTTRPDGSTQISIGIDQTGALAGLVKLFLQARTRRYLTLEAAGLKAASESG